MAKLRLPFTGIAIGIVISIVGIMASAPPCAFAEQGCPQGATSTFTNNVSLKSGLAYETTITSVNNTDDRTITLPDADTTLMSATSTDALQNKTIDFTLNTGSNYQANALGGTTLSSNITGSSLTDVGVLSGLDIGSNLTTIDQAAPGDINIEGNTVYRAGGADVPPSQGGTGTSSFTANSTIIGNGASGALSVDTSQKGDLLVGKTGGFPEDLAVGTTGQKLTADSTDPKGMNWTTVGAGGGLAVIDGFYLTNINQNWTSNWTDVPGPYAHWPASFGFTTTGSPVSESGGIFTFPETGVYELQVTMCNGISSTQYQGLMAMMTNNGGGSWFPIARDQKQDYNWAGSTDPQYCGRVVAFFDIDDISTHWIKFQYMCGSCWNFNQGSAPIESRSSFFFMKLAGS